MPSSAYSIRVWRYCLFVHGFARAPLQINEWLHTFFYSVFLRWGPETIKDRMDYFALTQELTKLREEALSQLPFNLNIIDNLPVNELSHSRILAQLLQFRTGSKFVILQSLLNEIQRKHPDTEFSRIQISQPKISQEKAHIDIWIRDEDYAIIVENKIYNAADQDAQISRYIDTTLGECHFPKERIFVIYLPQRPGDPEEQSWGDYKDSFKHRYCSFSFSEDILPWLKNKVTPLLYFEHEPLIKSCLIQYIDYLEGLFGKREYDKKEEMKTTEIELKLSLSNIGTKERYDKLTECDRDMSPILNTIRDLKAEARRKYWEMRCNQEHPGTKSIEGVGIFNRTLLFDNIPYVLSIGIYYSHLYCQLERQEHTVKRVDDELIRNLEAAMPQYKITNDYQTWAYFNIDAIDQVYNFFNDTWIKLEAFGGVFEKDSK